MFHVLHIPTGFYLETRGPYSGRNERVVLESDLDWQLFRQTYNSVVIYGDSAMPVEFLASSYRGDRDCRPITDYEHEFLLVPILDD